MSLKYLSNLWRSLEILLINCKVELKLWWTVLCFLFSCRRQFNVNNNADGHNIIFTIKDTKLYVPAVALTATDNQKLLRLCIKGFERSVYWNEYKAKSWNKIATNEFRCFFESNFVGVNRLLVLVYLNRADDVERFETKILSKGLVKNYYVIITGEKF